MDNDAVEILSEAESEAVWKQLKSKGEECKVLAPRYLFTDKHAPLRMSEKPLPLKATAPLVVPGFKDALSFGMRRTPRRHQATATSGAEPVWRNAESCYAEEVKKESYNS